MRDQDTLTCPKTIVPPFELELLAMIASGLQLRNARIPQTRKPVASTPFVLNFNGVSVIVDLVIGGIGHHVF